MNPSVGLNSCWIKRPTGTCPTPTANPRSPKSLFPESLTQPGNPSRSALVSPAASRSAVNPRKVSRKPSQLRVLWCGFRSMPM